ncbi:tetratricopeptide repeat protein [Clostridium sp. MB05]|uniref:tetratricopeptide repeat protein n=1 Tax=Clostridium sp. MB05 TaxID=3376682 RepID=UPI003981D9CC
MKRIEKLFSTIRKPLKSFFGKLGKIFKPIINGVNRTSGKVKTIYKKANDKNPYVEPIVVIGVSCFFVLVMILGIKSFTTVEEVNITKNNAEYLYYEGKYDEAIEEYNKMQNDEKWPIWKAKVADLYSLKGDFKKSNTLLKEVMIKRDKLIKEEGFDKYKDRDAELINSMLFTFIMNKQYDEAISLGESYISSHGQNKEILKTLFAAYISNNYIYKAEELTEAYPLDKNSSYDISVLANMNMLINRWDNGLELLKDAWNLNSNEIKVYDVISDMYVFNKEVLIKSLEESVDKNPNEDAYKMLLAKAYSMSAKTANKGEDLINLLEDKNITGSANDLIKFEIYNITNKKDEAEKYLDDASRKAKKENKESYMSYYISSLKAFNDKKYDEAFTLAKKAILAQKDYPNSYGVLVPKILLEKGIVKPTESYLRVAMQKEPFNYRMVLRVADYYSNLESNNEKAKEYYGWALNIKKDDSNLLYKLANLDIVDGKWDEAINKLNEALKIDENNSKYYRALGAVYLNKKMNEEGIELTRKAYSMNENDILALNNAGWYYINVEKDIARGYENIKGAYEGIPTSMDETIKNSIIDNYNKSKKLYEEFLKDESKELKIPTLTLFY